MSRISKVIMDKVYMLSFDRHSEERKDYEKETFSFIDGEQNHLKFTFGFKFKREDFHFKKFPEFKYQCSATVMTDHPKLKDIFIQVDIISKNKEIDTTACFHILVGKIDSDSDPILQILHFDHLFLESMELFGVQSKDMNYMEYLNKYCLPYIENKIIKPTVVKVMKQ